LGEVDDLVQAVGEPEADRHEGAEEAEHGALQPDAERQPNRAADQKRQKLAPIDIAPQRGNAERLDGECKRIPILFRRCESLSSRQEVARSISDPPISA